MENTSLLQSFATDKNGRIQSVDDVPRGLACECTCPVCGERVLARQGEVRVWHFAHASGADCEGAAEGALHLAAKQILLEHSGMMVPEMVVKSSVTLSDGRSGWGEARRGDAWIDYQNPEAEKSFGAIRPDIVVQTGQTLFFIEVAVTHFVDEEKCQALEQIAVPTIEIDLSEMKHEKWSWELLKEAVLDGSQYKRWIYVMDRAALELEAKNAALIDASDKPIPNKNNVFMLSAPSRGGVVRNRFWIGRRMVDVHERSFGLALWSPYDPELNERIKSLARYLGGQWQPKFKNWLFPVQAKPDLFATLEKWSGRGPDVTLR